jgi:hypothetical protein
MIYPLDCLHRSSQPKVGVQGKQSREDERLLGLIAIAGATYRCKDPVIHIVDCRPIASARANALTGHGTENTSNYPGAKVTFCNLENIHSIRDSYQRLERVAVGPGGATTGRQDDFKWGQLVEDTKWLTHQRLLLTAAHRVARLVCEREEPVLVHCRYKSKPFFLNIACKQHENVDIRCVCVCVFI